MDKTTHIDSYFLQFEKLISIIESTNDRIISDTPDTLIYDNANFFTKAFLTTICAYLESYLKDALMIIVEDANHKLSTLNLPHNLIMWSFSIKKEMKETDLKFKKLKVEIRKKDLDDHVSGNPFKTRDLFKKFGIELDKDHIYNSQKDEINSIVIKRNKILHHNDDASDISNKDLIDYIKAFKNYILNLDNLICKHIE